MQDKRWPEHCPECCQVGDWPELAQGGGRESPRRGRRGEDIWQGRRRLRECRADRLLLAVRTVPSPSPRLLRENHSLRLREPDRPGLRKRRTTWLPLPRAHDYPQLSMRNYHYLLVPQGLMYFIAGCLNHLHPGFARHPLRLRTGPATNSLAPNCPINVSTSVCA
jgi:hypothetical protein